MLRSRYFISAFCIFFLIAVVYLMPARWIAEKTLPQPALAHVTVSGTLWGGKALLQLDKKPAMFVWRFLPSHLLSGQWGYDVQLSHDDVELVGALWATNKNAIAWSNVSASLNLSILHDAAVDAGIQELSGGLSLKNFSGNYNLQTHESRLQGTGRFTGGRAVWLANNRAVETLIPNLIINARPQDKGAVLSISSETGVVYAQTHIDPLNGFTTTIYKAVITDFSLPMPVPANRDVVIEIRQGWSNTNEIRDTAK